MTTVVFPYTTLVQDRAVRRKGKLARRWFFVLLCAICFEGLARKFLPFLPSAVFYFAKDVVLVWGLVLFGVAPEVKRLALKLLGGWSSLLPAAFAWTLVEAFNPNVPSFGIAFLGLRSYWLWWLAPLVIASALRHDDAKTGAVRQLSWMSLCVAGFAILQFSRPADDAINTYALYEGRELNAVDVVGTTKRVRVSSTFSYLTGFTLFAQLVGTLLVGIGIGLPSRGLRNLAFAGAMMCLVTLPMGGSRAPVVMMIAGLGLVAWTSGLMSTKAGRRILGSLIAGALAVFLFAAEAAQGIVDRWSASKSETSSRVSEVLAFMPPFVFGYYDFPLAGTGTGSEQNAAYALRLRNSKYGAEAESGKIVVEQGPIGWMLLWLTRVGLVVAVIRLGRKLRFSQSRALAGCCVAVGFYIFIGRLYFDHVSQSLLFCSVGLLLSYGTGVLTPGTTAPKITRSQPPSIQLPRAPK